MALHEKTMVPHVLCDEIFSIEDEEFAVPIGKIKVPANSSIEGIVTLTVLECTPKIDLILNAILVNVVCMVQKELTIITPAGTLIPLEFGFRLEKTVKFNKCIPMEIQAIDPDFFGGVECYVVFVTGTDRITLHPSTMNPITGKLSNDACLDKQLAIQLRLKLIESNS